MGIFTDSLSSLFALRKTWLAPHRQRIRTTSSSYSRRSPTLVKARDMSVHIVKVKGHAGVVGNEIADRVAVMAATDGHDVRIDDLGHPSTHVKGVGLSCPWAALPKSIVTPGGVRGNGRRSRRRLPVPNL